MEVVGVCASNALALQVSLEDLPRKIWNIDSTVALARDPKWVDFEFRELFEPLLKCLESILGLSHIILHKVCIIISFTESDTSW